MKTQLASSRGTNRRTIFANCIIMMLVNESLEVIYLNYAKSLLNIFHTRI